jgi:SIR2-like domain
MLNCDALRWPAKDADSNVWIMMSDEILPVPAVPPGLREAAQRGTLIPFVGAGASRLAGCPTWIEFADRTLKACVEAGKFSHGQLAQIAHLGPRIKLSIARGIQAEHNLFIAYAKIINPQQGYEHETGRRVYRSLTKLGQTFVTTNYDGWLDNEITDAKPTVEAFGQQDTPPATPQKRKVYAEPNDFTAANLNQSKSVFHLHGTLAKPADMIITTRDYITRYANDRQGDDPQKENRTLTFLDHLFQYKTVLFVGYGLEDLEILEHVIQKARLLPSTGQTEARHFMLQGYFSHERELMKSLSRYYKQCDIQLLPFLRDKKDWPQLIEVLEKFADAMPAAEPMHLQKLLEMESLLDE